MEFVHAQLVLVAVKQSLIGQMLVIGAYNE